MIEIRKLTGNDAEAFRDLRLKGLRHHPEAFGSSYEEEEPRSLEEWRARLSRDARQAFVAGAWEGDVLAGTIGFYRNEQIKSRHKGNIWGVYVDSEHRRQGIAAKLLHYVLQEAAGLEGLTRVLLTVQADNEAAVRLYEAFGFTVYGREPKALFVSGRYVDESMMVCALEPK